MVAFALLLPPFFGTKLSFSQPQISKVVPEKIAVIKNVSGPKLLASATPDWAQYIVPIVEPKPIAKPVVKVATIAAPSDITGLIHKYAAEFKANPDKMIKIAKCESNFRSNAVSPSGLYVGIYQFNPTTWASNRRAMGLDPDPALRLNAEEATNTAAFKMGRDGYGAWPVCSTK